MVTLYSSIPILETFQLLQFASSMHSKAVGKESHSAVFYCDPLTALEAVFITESTGCESKTRTLEGPESAFPLVG